MYSSKIKKRFLVLPLFESAHCLEPHEIARYLLFTGVTAEFSRNYLSQCLESCVAPCGEELRHRPHPSGLKIGLLTS